MARANYFLGISSHSDILKVVHADYESVGTVSSVVSQKLPSVSAQRTNGLKVDPVCRALLQHLPFASSRLVRKC